MRTFCRAVLLGLLLLTQYGAAQAGGPNPKPLTVTASYDNLTPAPAVVEETITASLHASTTPPDPTSAPLSDPKWSWTVVGVLYRSTQNGKDGAPPYGYGVSISQPSTTSGEASMSATFSGGGYWTVNLKASVSYTAGSDCWYGEQMIAIPITVIDLNLSTDPTIVAIGDTAPVYVSVIPADYSPTSDISVDTDDLGVAQVVSWSYPITTVSGVNVGSTRCFGRFRGRRCPPIWIPPAPPRVITLYTYCANLGMNGVAANGKLNPGGNVGVNADNQNGSAVTNNIPAKRDFEKNPIPNETDLASITLACDNNCPPGTPFNFQFTATNNGRARISVWDTMTKQNNVPLPANYNQNNVPNSLYVEGTLEGAAVKEIDLKLKVSNGATSSTDTIKVTVTPILQNLYGAKSRGTAPDIAEMPAGSGDWYLRSAAGGALGTQTFALNASALPAPRGNLDLVQNVWFENKLAGGFGADLGGGMKQKWDFAAPNAGKTLVDCAAATRPFYRLAHTDVVVNGVETVSDLDSPKLRLITVAGGMGVLPAAGKTTTVDVAYRYKLYAAWTYPDGTLYPLGNCEWNIRYNGVISPPAVGAANYTYAAGGNNANNSSTGWTRSNAVPDALGAPVGNDGGADWN